MALAHQLIVTVMAAAVLAACMANPNWNWNPCPPKKIVVGGSENWRFGFNYADWALKNGPFYLNDVLVFKYDPPSNITRPHSVYLLPNFRSYLNCSLAKAKLVASPTQGGNQGFEFTLKKWQPHYFACGEHDGIHCNDGLMKFMVMPMFRRCRN